VLARRVDRPGVLDVVEEAREVDGAVAHPRLGLMDEPIARVDHLADPPVRLVRTGGARRRAAERDLAPAYLDFGLPVARAGGVPRRSKCSPTCRPATTARCASSTRAAIREQVADAFDIVVCQARVADGSRRVVSIAEIVRVAAA
jgi:hypothetical protein